MPPAGTSRHFAATQQFGRFRMEADIHRAVLTEPDLSVRALVKRASKLCDRVEGRPRRSAAWRADSNSCDIVSGGLFAKLKVPSGAHPSGQCRVVATARCS